MTRRRLAALGLVFACAVALAGRPRAEQFDVLHEFTVAEGHPVGAVAADRQGRLYGTAVRFPDIKKSDAIASVYRLSPPAAGRSAWTYETLYAFETCPFGCTTVAVAVGPSSAVYGAFEIDGTGLQSIYRLAPNADGSRPWHLQTLRTFDGVTEDPFNLQAFSIDGRERVYATAYLGGPDRHGAFIRLSPPADAQHAWSYEALRVLHPTDGAFPIAPLLIRGTLDAPVLFGVTGSNGSPPNCGGVFQMTPPPGGSGEWKLALIHTPDCANAGFLDYGIVATRSLDLFGTRLIDGSGPVRYDAFRLTPPAAAGSAWTFTELATISGFGAPVESSDGRLYAVDGVGLVRITPRDHGGTLTPWNVQTIPTPRPGTWLSSLRSEAGTMQIYVVAYAAAGGGTGAVYRIAR